jgi:hypothetical protein
MRNKEIKLPLTPITEETFERQGWTKVNINDPMFEDFEDEEMEEESANESEEELKEAFYYILPLPKDREDVYSLKLVSNATDENGLLKEMGLQPGTFFVEIMDTDGLGYCQSEEELEVLYKALTGKNLED